MSASTCSWRSGERSRPLRRLGADHRTTRRLCTWSIPSRPAVIDAIRPRVESHLSVDDLYQTAAHEFGHVLGRKHCLRWDSVMNDRDRVPKITELDVRRFFRLVAIPNGAHVVGRRGQDSAAARRPRKSPVPRPA